MKEEVAWWNLTPAERTVYLRENHRRLAQLDAAQRPANDPPGSVYHLDSAHITDFSSFLCALGEAINGPGGYFGSSMGALDDCAVGGVGFDQFTVKLVAIAQLEGDGLRVGRGSKADQACGEKCTCLQHASSF